jgi:hypothetical protein
VKKPLELMRRPRLGLRRRIALLPRKRRSEKRPEL